MVYRYRIVGVGLKLSGVDGMYVSGVMDICGSIRSSRVRVNCPLSAIGRVCNVLDTYTIPYKVQAIGDRSILTINQEEGLVLLYRHIPLICSVRRGALKKIVTSICLGGLEPYPLGEVDRVGWLQGVMDMRGSYITSDKNKWYSITTTNTDVVGYLSQVLMELDINYNLYTVERVGRRTLYNTRVYKGRDIGKLLQMQAIAIPSLG